MRESKAYDSKKKKQQQQQLIVFKDDEDWVYQWEKNFCVEKYVDCCDSF
jgi:hypothetical protein